MSVSEESLSGLLAKRENAKQDRARTSLHVLARLARVLDRSIGITGRISGWLCLLLTLMVAGDVVARYVWHVGSVAEQELEWHVLAVIAMLGASYTLQQGEHVRVDIFYQHYSDQLKRWLDVLVPLFIVVPTALFIAYISLKFVQMSYALHEISPDPGGLPARYLLKAFLPIGFVLVAVQGVAMVCDGIVKLLTHSKT
jgi:TRAP-type mannitol/chloroaromatic compound transport system permease small subunit